MISFCSPCFAESISVLLVKIGRTVEKLFKGVFFSRLFPDYSPKTNSENFLKFLCVSACRAELIGILFVEIGSFLKMWFLGVFFTKVSPVALLAWNLELSWIFDFFSLSTWIYWYIDCKNRSNGSKFIQEGIFGSSPILSLKRGWKMFCWSLGFPLVELNPLVYCKWESVERVKS
jgi:hypothetical protein